MIDKMRELTDRQMLDFVKELEKRRIPLHSVSDSAAWEAYI